MYISAQTAYRTAAYAGAAGLLTPGEARQGDAASPEAASSGERVSISPEARARAEADVRSAATLVTDQGERQIDLEAYFAGASGAAPALLATLPPLILPSQANLQALNSHLSATFPKFLAEHGIPQAPEQISYDQEGKIQLPEDYPYLRELKRALENSPAMARALNTTTAIASHVAELNKLIPFEQELAGAQTRSQAEAIVAKYRYLFTELRPASQTSLSFSARGESTPMADGRPMLAVS